MNRNFRARLDKLESEMETEDDHPPDDSLDVVINRYLVISRERAEREDREILEVVDTPGETEHVKVEP